MNPTKQLPGLIARSGGMTRQKLARLKARRWKYPLSIERGYASALSRYLDKVWREYSVLAVGTMPREDALEDLQDGTSGPSLAAIVTISENMVKFNKKELDAFKTIAIGAAFDEDEPWLPPVLDRWQKEQVSLITKASNDMRDAVARRVRDGIKAGKLGRDVEKDVLREMPGISHNRAKIIARDQCSKLNASLTEGRMSDAGLETYVWDTVQDERVRGNPSGIYARALPSHWVMQGLVCRWDDPTVCRDKQGNWVPRPADAPLVHPGIAILCRCVALPNWDEFADIGDSDLPAVEPGPAPKVEPEPEPQDFRKDLLFLKDKKMFEVTMSGEFPSTDTFTKKFMSDAWERLDRLASLSPVLAKAYDKMFRGINSIEKGAGKFYSASNSIKVPGVTRQTTKDGKKVFEKSGSVLVHEGGHAIDNMLAKRFYRGKYVSDIRLDAFGGRNLGEIIKDELVTPTTQAMKAERPKVIASMIKSVPDDLRKSIADVLAQPGEKSPFLSLIGTPYARVGWSLRALDAPRDIWEALAKGRNIEVERFIVSRTDEVRFASEAAQWEKITPTFKELQELSMAGTDYEAVYGGLCDMFEAATGEAGFFGSWGHGVGYWKSRPWGASAEGFAEILEMLASPDPGAARILDKYLPTARDFVLHVISEGLQ